MGKANNEIMNLRFDKALSNKGNIVEVCGLKDNEMQIWDFYTG